MSPSDCDTWDPTVAQLDCGICEYVTSQSAGTIWELVTSQSYDGILELFTSLSDGDIAMAFAFLILLACPDITLIKSLPTHHCRQDTAVYYYI
jgi:hypothetical protein